MRASARAALPVLHGRRFRRRFRGNAGVAAKAGARGALIAASIAFVLGFSTVFIALGAGASTIGRLLRVYQEPLAMIAGALIILMGLNFLGILRIPLLSREARFQSQGKPASAVAAYVMAWRLPLAGHPASVLCSGRS
jgi:cytochrome c-type biogenesis protein